MVWSDPGLGRGAETIAWATLDEAGTVVAGPTTTDIDGDLPVVTAWRDGFYVGWNTAGRPIASDQSLSDPTEYPDVTMQHDAVAPLDRDRLLVVTLAGWTVVHFPRELP